MITYMENSDRHYLWNNFILPFFRILCAPPSGVGVIFLSVSFSLNGEPPKGIGEALLPPKSLSLTDDALGEVAVIESGLVKAFASDGLVFFGVLSHFKIEGSCGSLLSSTLNSSASPATKDGRCEGPC